MLHALVDYARREQLTAEPGLKPKTVRWLLTFSADGQFLGLHDLTGGDKKSKGREFPACPDLTQQEMVAAGAGCRHFLVDSADVVCLWTKGEETDDKLAAKHAYFVDLLGQAVEVMPGLRSVATALGDQVTLATIQSELSDRKAKPTDLTTVAVKDDGRLTIFVEQSDWRDWWQARRGAMATDRKARAQPASRRKSASPDAAPRMRCLLGGELVEPLATHNKIEGLAGVGGLAMGDTLTSFDKEAFGSFGLQQGANAAMSETMVKTYATALNHLIRHRSYGLAGVKVLYWYSGSVQAEEDPFAALKGTVFEPAPAGEAEGEPLPSEALREQRQAENRARKILDAIRSGHRPDLAGLRYYSLTLSANSGRVVIRDWMEGSFAELVEAVDAWFNDLAIVSRDGRQIISSHKFAAVLAAPLRDLKDAPASLVTTLWRCALKRHPIPHHVMAQTLQRVRNDFLTGESPLHARLALLKAFCNRNERTPTMNVELNEYENDSAYLCGRVMAILAAIQRKALGDVGAGVVQRFYAAASATPALILGRLVRTAQVGHLPKIRERGLQIWFERQLAEVWARLTERPKSTLTLEEQTLFAMGYYQQIAKRPESMATETDGNGDGSAACPVSTQTSPTIHRN